MDAKFYQEKIVEEKYWLTWFILMLSFSMVCYKSFIWVFTLIWDLGKWFVKFSMDMVEKQMKKGKKK